MRRAACVLLVGGLVAASSSVVASLPASGTISLARRAVSWTGGPLLGGAADPATCVGGCDEFSLAITVPPSYWRAIPGGVLIRIDWRDRNDELDLLVFDEAGNEVASSIELHTNVEQAFLYTPKPGTYRVQIVALQAKNVKYRARAWMASIKDRPAATARNTMRFAPPTFVDPQIWASMPSVWAAGDGPIYVTSPWSLPQQSNPVWRSLDGGRTFRHLPSYVAPGVVDPRLRSCSTAVGGGDSDVITDRTGRVYFDDLWAGNVTVGTSTDRGDAWTCNPAAGTMPEQDRPWLAPAPKADGNGPNIDAYLAYRDLGAGGLTPYAGEALKPVSEHLDLTRDGGATWRNATTYARDAIGFTGPLFTAGDGTIYQVYQYESSVMLARSTDEGRTVRVLRVADRYASPANQWLGGDVDAAGNVYAAWVDQGTWDVLVSVSRNRGATWSKPLRVNPPASESAAMPWVAAGKAGDVAVAWYGARGSFSPNVAPDSARWYPWVARSTNATSAAPTFQATTLSQTPVRFGKLCLEGLTCDSDRRMGDFFEIDIAPDGAVVASFADTGRIQRTKDGYTPGPYVMVARQLSGLGMARTARAAVEPAGDAFAPDGANDPALSTLDLTGLPAYRRLNGAFRVSFKLSSARDLTRALKARNVAVATDAYWIVLWKANNRVEYAGLHVDGDGTISFFGGDEPVSIGRPEVDTKFTDKMASYPETFSLPGNVDAATGVVTIDVPFGMFHLRRGDVLHSMQAFSMTSLRDKRTFLQPLLVVDSTPAQSVRIG